MTPFISLDELARESRWETEDKNCLKTTLPPTHIDSHKMPSLYIKRQSFWKLLNKVTQIELVLVLFPLFTTRGNKLLRGHCWILLNHPLPKRIVFVKQAKCVNLGSRRAACLTVGQEGVKNVSWPGRPAFWQSADHKLSMLYCSGISYITQSKTLVIVKN